VGCEARLGKPNKARGFCGIMSHIFISYNQEDADFAALLMVELEKNGFETWLDKQRLRAGADWSEEIDDGILTAAAVVLVLSPSSTASQYVTYEWSCAIGAGIRVVPLLRRQTEIHPRLRRLQYLDFCGNVRPWSDLFRELRSIKQEGQTHWRPPRDTPPHIKRAVVDLDSGNFADRRGAIGAIAQSQHNVVPAALQHALKSPFSDVRAHAAVALAERDDPAAVTEVGLRALTEALRQDSSGAMNAFLRIGRASLDHLTLVARSETDPARLYAIYLLSSVGGKDAIPTLLDLVGDADEDVADNAVRQLGELKVVQAVPSILHLMIERATKYYESKARWGPSKQPVRTLIDIGDKSIEPQLFAATKHKVPTVRMCAAQVFGGLFGASAVPVLADLLSDTHTAHYFGRRGQAEPADEVTVAEVAAKALGDINTPEAQKLVLQYRHEHPENVVLSIQNLALNIPKST
jgi:HEAT repeat protein